MKSKLESPRNSFTIGVFAHSAGVNVETIRFYQRKGLLPEPAKPLGSIRRYSVSDVARVKFVKSAQQLGFSLDEIGELLQLQDGTQCSKARTLAELKLKSVRQKLTGLTRMEFALTNLVQQCCLTTGEVACPLISSLHRGAGA